MEERRPPETDPRASRRRRRQRSGAVALGVLAGLACAEIAARLIPDALGDARPNRILYSYDHPFLRYHLFQANPDDEFVPMPQRPAGAWRLLELTDPPREIALQRLPETPWSLVYAQSQQDARQQPISPVPLPGVTRIGGFGDSFAFGIGVRVESTMLARLDRRLGTSVEVVNWGESGADLAGTVARLERLTGRYPTDLAIVVYNPNDVPVRGALASRNADRGALVNVSEQRGDALDAEPLLGSRVRSRIERWWRRRGEAQESLDWYRQAHDDAFNPGGLAELDRLLGRLAAMERPRVALVVHPLLIDLDEQPLAAAHARVLRAAESAGLPGLDLAPALAGQRADDLWVDATDHHPNRRGHEIAADAVEAWLRSEFPRFLE